MINQDYLLFRSNSNRSSICFSDTNQKISLKKIKEGKLRPKHFPKTKKRYNNLNLDVLSLDKQNRNNFSFASILCIQGAREECPCFKDQVCPWVGKWIQQCDVVFSQKEVDQCIHKQIEKDIIRTQNVYGRQGLEVVYESLMTYCSFDKQLGYIQGFNEIMGAIVIHSKEVAKSLTIFDILMRKRNLRKIYIKEFQFGKSMAARAATIINKRCHNLFYHLTISLGIQLEPFLIGWIIPLFTNIVNITHLHLVIDGIVRNGISFLYAFIFSIFLTLKDQLLQIITPEDVMVELSVYSLKNRQIDWSILAEFALKFPLTQQEIGNY